MFDIVTTDQEQASPSVHGCGVDYREPGLTAACARGAEALGAEATNKPSEKSDQDQHHRDGEQDTPILSIAEQKIHCSPPLVRDLPCLDGSLMAAPTGPV
jgi:hypothetical protein